MRQAVGMLAVTVERQGNPVHVLAFSKSGHELGIFPHIQSLFVKTEIEYRLSTEHDSASYRLFAGIVAAKTVATFIDFVIVAGYGIEVLVFHEKHPLKLKELLVHVIIGVYPDDVLPLCVVEAFIAGGNHTLLRAGKDFDNIEVRLKDFERYVRGAVIDHDNLIVLRRHRLSQQAADGRSDVS